MSRAALTITRNDLTPALGRLMQTARNPRAVLQAMGNTFKSITVGNFNSSGLQYRPIPWVAKKDGTPATLKKRGLLWHSFNLEVTDRYATLSNPTPYAAVHQFGSKEIDESRAHKMNIPPRPFYPVINGRLTDAADKLISAAGRRVLEKQAEP
jgi:phage gpG-like protein